MRPTPNALLRFSLMLAAAMPAFPARAQVVTRENYYDFLPPPPRLVSQTRASAELKLFGDREAATFVDRNPMDGIDDARAARLLAIAERFSPIIKPNNFLVPRDPRALLGERQPLISDLWIEGRLSRSDTIFFEEKAPAADGIAQQSSDRWRAENDIRLSRLLAARGPRAVLPQVIPADADSDRVLYFDFPGEDRRSWRNVYKSVDPNAGSRVFMHPFLLRISGDGANARYQLLLQYWLFYPFNDAINAHEGDWEHINVQVTTRARAASASSAAEATLSEAEVQRLLADDAPLDSLVIAGLEYYFHRMVVLLDYVELAKPATASKVPRDVHRAWEHIGYVRQVVQRRLAMAGGKLATHPFIFTGGNNRGPDELTSLTPRFSGSLKRNSGASYPFPGTWRTVAGFGVTETVFGDAIPKLKSDTTAVWHAAIDDARYRTYQADDIVLLPDWECLEPAIASEPAARRAWGWMVLPVYFGFPVSSSPGGGIVMHTDVGNIAPLSMTFNNGWNHSGATTRYAEYKIRVLRTPVSPNTPWTIVQNGWGFLNIPFAIWGLMPGYNVGLIELMPWVAGAMHVVGAPPRRTFVPDQLPRRFTSAGVGMTREFGGHEFARLLSGPGATAIGAEHRVVATGPRAWLNLYFGEHFSFENTYAWTTSAISYQATNATGAHPVTGFLDMRQLTGGFRYDLLPLFDEHARFFARGGYAWLWYRPTDQRVDGISLGASPSHDGYLPPLLPSVRWFPNTWYAGGGVEWFTPRNYWLLGLLGTGVRVEYSEYANRIRYRAPGSGTATVFRGDLAASLVFGW